MMPVQPIPMMATEQNITAMPMAATPYMPMNLINNPQNFVYFQDPMTELAESSGAVIRQQVEMIEALTGCETQNRYHVFLQTQMGLKYAFKCNEKSDACSRCCCPGESRPFTMIIRHIISYDQLNSDLAKIIIQIDKPCTMACCCLCRPHMDVRFVDTNQFLGRVRQPCTCCDLETEIYDGSGNLRYQIIGDCCQFGLCCGSTAQKLASIKFNIIQNGMIVGSMRKLGANFGEFFTKADSYQILFPANATPQEKMLLIIAGLMIDYQYFENDDDTPDTFRPYY